MKIAASPLYLDTSALVKLYVPEPESDELDHALVGHDDLVISDLAITELTSSLMRRLRERGISLADARLVYRTVQQDLSAGRFRRAALVDTTFHGAERLLFSLGPRLLVRAADALHLALAEQVGARAVVTFDDRMRGAIALLGSIEPAP